MPRLLAIEWNEAEARLAVAASHGDQVVIEHAFSTALQSAASAEEQVALDAAPQIAAALASRGIGKIDALVSVGRGNIELRQFSVPPAPDDELPDLVRFQALREFTGLQEDWPLDFVPIDDAPDQPRRVLAATIDPALIKQTQATCQAAGLKLRRLLLRPCSAASLLLRRTDPGASQVRLLIDLLVDEVDLTVLIDRKVVFMRTTRLSGNPLTAAEPAQALLAEIRRTAFAAQNQESRRVELIVLCGTGAQHAALAESIAQQLSQPVELLDPFAGLQLEGDLRRALPENPGRFAPLLGMLLDELSASTHAVDFLHPRRRPEPPGRRKSYLIAGVGIAAAVFTAVLCGWLWLASLDGQVQQLLAESREWDEQLTPASAKAEQTAAAIEKWQAGEVLWLDEFRRLAEQLPKADEAMLTQLQAGLSSRAGDNPQISMEGLARSVDTVAAIAKGLRDETHHVECKGTGEDVAQKPYSWRFKSSLSIGPEPR